MSVEAIKELLRQSTYLVNANTGDLKPGDDMVEVPNGGSSVNWLLGHIVWWRNEMVELAGGQRPWQNGTGHEYRGNPGQRGPKNFEPSAAMELSALRKGFSECGCRLENILDANGVDSETGMKLLTLLGHEFYHAGQLGVLRRIAGREGAV